MQTMPARIGVGATTASGYPNEYRQTNSGSVYAVRGCRKATLTKRSRESLEPSLPEPRMHQLHYLHVINTSPGSARIIIPLADALPTPELRPAIERPKRVPLPSLKTSPHKSTQLKMSAKPMIEHMGHLRFLKRASTGADAAITAETARIAANAWREVWEASGGKIPVPSAGTNSDGKVFYSWDNGRYHLDLDIVPNEPASIFFCDRQKDEYWYEEYQIGSPLPVAVVAKLNLFA